MAEAEAIAAEEVEGDEGLESMSSEAQAKPQVAPLKKARPVGAAKKRKSVPRTKLGKKKDVETKTVPPKKMKETASMDLSDPSQLTMKEIIRRAEAIERAKAKEEAARKAEEKEKKGSGSRSAARDMTTPAAQNTSAPSNSSAPSVLTPQVQIVNGRIVINQQSLMVAAQASTREDIDTYRRVEEDRPKLNSNSYSNRTHVERWKQEDTDLFYKALQQFGTDFELIQNLFPGRTRKQVKSKFKNEERLNPVRLADALGHKIQDQSHHYRAILEMIKSEKPVGDPDEGLLESLLRPVVTNETSSGQPVATQVVASEEKMDKEGSVEVPANTVALEKAKPDDPIVPVSDPILFNSAVLPQSDVGTITSKNDSPTSEDPATSVPSDQSKNNASRNRLGSYGNPLSSYVKEPISGNSLGNYENLSKNPLGSYGKNPLGMYN
ncbi:uncharacterized protein [Physcomitrium patens]|nr:transcription factor TFIIIB component B''-like [Physcomitrium patens]PNR31944.1 hypothetical protein PHYPA_026067 [Physcomitrium patens]|eukprot:XP_024359822.1 transcription factor TFIIIB component B''-like [Physcomitrella patens]